MIFEINPEMVEQIAMFAFYSDMNANLDLKRRIIETKKEYIADFTKRFTGFIGGPLSSGLSAETILVPHKKKNKSGCDTAIIITSKGLSKIALSKYKYPSFEDPQLNWDKTKKSSKKSLFSSQLKKQKRYDKEFAVFQKIINKQLKDHPQTLSKNSSNCIWYSDAASFNQECRRSPNELWGTQQILEMFEKKGTADIGTILKAVCLDSVAKPVKITNGIEDFVKEYKLPSRVISINVLD
ncbi:hypothetical protein [uncultured Cocleimonas sp.]|uniref:hypothetical protein n=1 Tax=uncultured Cocleimonas sp. TaxID=1051587 RepID=UPI002617EE9E|nr:hypothetical protein [uncultured Cocleimonas sp.]